LLVVVEELVRPLLRLKVEAIAKADEKVYPTTTKVGVH
jgi:hypothetical protein